MIKRADEMGVKLMPWWAVIVTQLTTSALAMIVESQSSGGRQIVTQILAGGIAPLGFTWRLLSYIGIAGLVGILLAFPLAYKQWKDIEKRDSAYMAYLSALPLSTILESVKMSFRWHKGDDATMALCSDFLDKHHHGWRQQL